MCKCKLNFNNLASILNTFESIEEIDLSQNDFSEYQENILGNHKDLLTDENSYNLTNTVQAGDLSFSKKLLYLKQTLKSLPDSYLILRDQKYYP